ncbi:MAG TPA: 16S rRNA (uracil(1498)-N(3))-methyltransferase [Planctomycetaceae bacterium]|nr:16S rRNA (uracil(1498)-N(3))-methyltransferase [Planctomycetaceae bacterium]HIQ23168.1 16S rRNA (uracil(1498)-N(3))-methyltransferase [Planctomycetota bacterium]
MSNRYFVPHPIDGEAASLSGGEAHHLVHVMRAKVGDEVVLFDGSGAEFPARIKRIERSRVWLAVLGRQEVYRELPVGLTLGVCLPKGDRQRWLVEKAVELGVRRLVPLQTARSVVVRSPARLHRLVRVVVEASKQCGRNRLMEIASPHRFQDFVRCGHGDSLRLLADPSARDAPDRWFGAVDRSTVQVLVAIGPEGGFTAEELRLAAQSGWRLVNLGPRMLRIETAAVVLAALAAQAVQNCWARADRHDRLPGPDSTATGPEMTLLSG